MIEVISNHAFTHISNKYDKEVIFVARFIPLLRGLVATSPLHQR
jgi:membrane protein DedA with SNARE-associated domain